MRFLLDESAEVRIATFLANNGHDVKVVQRDFAVGLSDDEILRLALAEDRIVITNDRDFGDLVYRDGAHHRGVVYFRFPLDSTADQKIASLATLLASRPHDLGKFVVLSPGGIRIGGEGT
jgi:predicted nuclease of predicted toxin-antitoxin system